MNTRTNRKQSKNGFTRVDAAALTMVLFVLGLVGWPVVTGNGLGSASVGCMDNLSRLTLAWQLYAEDSGGKLVNNFGIADMTATVSARTYLNWTHNIMDWSTDPSNTNRTLMATSRLYPYLQNPTQPFKCPADIFVSAPQRGAGWSGRLRSYSMNGYMGRYAINNSDSSYRGENLFTPSYRQFVMSSSIARPESSIVFLDEHPDSINDGYFINVANSQQWYDLPGSHHNGAAGVSFADGHVEMHFWLDSRTKLPVRYGFVSPGPMVNNVDHAWLTARMSVTHPTLAVSSGEGEAKVVWTPTTSTYALQSSPSLSQPDWTNVPEPAARDFGQVAVTAKADGGERYFRLLRP